MQLEQKEMNMVDIMMHHTNFLLKITDLLAQLTELRKYKGPGLLPQSEKGLTSHPTFRHP